MKISQTIETNFPYSRETEYFFIMDTETTSLVKGSFADVIPYDIGFSICDILGNIVYSVQYVVKEIFENYALMENAFYFEKMPQYIKLIAEGKIEKLLFMQIRDRVIEKCIQFNVHTVGAYNYPFDRRAIYCLVKFLYPYIADEYKPQEYYAKGAPKPLVKDFSAFIKKHFFYKDVKELCVMSLACETLGQDENFATFCMEHNLLTPKNNFKTSAEVMYMFITNDGDFKEEHTGQDDSIIECLILAESFAYAKKNEIDLRSGVIFNAWRLAQVNNHKEK